MCQKHKIINSGHMRVIMSLSSRTQRITCVKSTKVQLCGDKISNYVHIISNYEQIIVIMRIYM